jgi:hypothetical protein
VSKGKGELLVCCAGGAHPALGGRLAGAPRETVAEERILPPETLAVSHPPAEEDEDDAAIHSTPPWLGADASELHAPLDRISAQISAYGGAAPAKHEQRRKRDPVPKKRKEDKVVAEEGELGAPPPEPRDPAPPLPKRRRESKRKEVVPEVVSDAVVEASPLEPFAEQADPARRQARARKQELPAEPLDALKSERVGPAVDQTLERMQTQHFKGLSALLVSAHTQHPPHATTHTHTHNYMHTVAGTRTFTRLRLRWCRCQPRSGMSSSTHSMAPRRTQTHWEMATRCERAGILQFTRGG